MVVKLEGGGSKSKSKSEREIIQKNNGNKKIKKVTFLRFAGIPCRYASDRGGWAFIFLWLFISCLMMGTHSCNRIRKLFHAFYHRNGIKSRTEGLQEVKQLPRPQLLLQAPLHLLLPPSLQLNLLQLPLPPGSLPWPPLPW